MGSPSTATTSTEYVPSDSDDYVDYRCRAYVDYVGPPGRSDHEDYCAHYVDYVDY